MNFVKKTYGRTTHKGLSMLGQRETTTDIGFNQELQTFNGHLKIMKKFLADLKVYIGAFKTLSVSQNSLIQGIEAFYEQSSPLYQTWKKAQENALVLDQYRQRMDESIDGDIIAPLNARMALYKTLKKRIAERERRLTDYDRFKAEVRTLTQNPNTKAEKLQESQRRMNVAKHSYEVLEAELMQDLKALHADRLNFFDPCFAVMVRMQSGYYVEGARLMSEVVSLVRHIEGSAHVSSPITPEDRTMANPKNVPVFSESYAPSPAPQSGSYGSQPPQPSYSAQPSPYGAQPPAYGGQPAPYGGQPQPAPYGGQPAPYGGQPAPYGGQPQQPYGGGGDPYQRSVPPTPQPPARPGAPPPPQRKQARGTFAFTGASPSELSFNVGDVLTIISQDGDWWLAELHGRQGLVPFNYVQLI